MSREAGAIQILETALYYERQKIADQAKAMRSSEIAQLRLAFDSAKRAGLNEKQLSNYTNLDSPALNFLLGAKFIQARLSTLQEMPLVYPARYLEIKAQLDELKKLDNISLDKMQGFQVVVAPSLPAQRDAPKCRIPDDHITPSRRGYLMARDVLRDIFGRHAAKAVKLKEPQA